ncbi:MAG: sigma-54-dependent Fis family transcriptional regulator [Deltaproteobacteria bacterium]|nr:sigma-54-dependent Fis family transcriptional regulator [Deltaproteobacteria bacterium]
MSVNRHNTILVVDDEKGVCQSFSMVFKNKYHVLVAGSGKEAIDIFTKKAIDLILLDILLPDTNGIELLKKFKDADPTVEVVMVTAVKEIKTAVKAIKLGAYDYIIKPFDVDHVLNRAKRALEKRGLVKEVSYLRYELERFHLFEKMVGKDKKMKNIFEMISIISQSNGAALIQGESGTGKELVARAIHNRGLRSKHPFVVINCAAIPATLMESEIFGYNRGAFTGANHTSIGKLEIADKGVVFLDDIDSLDISMQAKLLRIIQEKEFERLGSNKVVKADLRFVAASNKDLEKLITQGKFREDLFYRLNVFPIKLPPLRKRRGDIPLLLNHFLEIFTKHTGKPPKTISERAVKAFQKYDWPGNIRELKNLVERLITITKGSTIRVKDLSFLNIDKKEVIKDLTLKEAVKTFEKQYIAQTLERVNGNRKKAAERLGIHRNTLLSKTNELGLKN